MALFDEAPGHPARSDRRFEQARTRLVFGEHLRRMTRRTDARAPLRAAIDVFRAARGRALAQPHAGLELLGE